MNNGNLEEKIFMGKFAIIILRILYVFLMILSIGLFIDSSYIGGFVCGVVAVIIVLINIFLKSYKKKLEKLQSELDSEYKKKVDDVMKERQKMADEINKNVNLEIDDSKITYTDDDRKRIEKNCKIMKKNGLPYMEQMKLIPFDSVVCIKSKEEIAHQAIIEYFVARKAYNRLNGISDTQDAGLVQNVFKYQLMTNPNVMSLFQQISNGEIDEINLNEFSYMFVRVEVYFWVLGLTHKPILEKHFFNGSVMITTNLMEKYNSIDDLISHCKMINSSEIIEYADLITRYEWAMIELRQAGRESKHIISDCILEHKRAMDWITTFDPNKLLKQDNVVK